MSKLDDIAKVAGVSRHTVARILNGKRLEKWPSKQEQGDRIRRLAEEMGYRPNASARALVLGKFNCVGLVMSTQESRSPITHAMLAEIDSVLAEHNVHLAIARLSDSLLTNQEYVPKILREWLCDGIIINYRAAVPPKMKKLMEDFRIPAIWLNADLEKDSVYPDDIAASREATKRLLEAGHRSIAYIDHSFARAKRVGNRHYSNEGRLKGYIAVIEAAGFEPIFVHDNEKKDGIGFRERISNVLAKKDRPTAFVSGSRIAARVVAEIAAGRGLCIPQDLSYVTFGAPYGTDTALWDESAVVSPDRAICRQAAKMVMRKIAQPQVQMPSVKVPFEVVAGNTIAPPVKR